MRWGIVVMAFAILLIVGIGIWVLVDVRMHPESPTDLLIGINPFITMAVLFLVIIIALIFICFGEDKDVD